MILEFAQRPIRYVLQLYNIIRFLPIETPLFIIQLLKKYKSCKKVFILHNAECCSIKKELVFYMSKYVATLLLELDDSSEGRKPDSEMVSRYLLRRVKKGLVNENCFRGKIVLNILKNDVSVMQFE